MKTSGWFAATAVIAALALGASAPGAAASTDCGDYKKVENLVADGISCGDSKRVVKVWINTCNYAGRCVLDVNALGEQYTCKGRKSGSTARITCKGLDSGNKAKFTSPV